MDFTSLLSRLFTPAGTGALISQGQAGMQLATDAFTKASNATDQAIAAAKDASLSPLDSESARAAQEALWKKLLNMQGAAASFMTPKAGGA